MSRFTLLFFFLTACSAPPPELTVAAAASTQQVLVPLVEAFAAATGREVTTVFASSGKLTAQIGEGAPYDLLLSADARYPEALALAGETAGPPRVFAYGHLVLWHRDTLPPRWADLTREPAARLAIANPRTAPYGRAAMHLLRQRTDFPEIESRLVYGENVAQTNQFVFTGAADFALTARGSLPPDPGAFLGVDPTHHPPLEQTAVVTRHGAANPTAERFLDFLFSPRARQILRDFGYSPHGLAPPAADF